MSCIFKWEIKVISLLLATMSQHLKNPGFLFSKGSFFICLILIPAKKIHGRDSDSDVSVYFSPVWFSSEPDYLFHTDLRSSLQNHKPHSTDPMALINCPESIFEIRKCDLTKIKLLIQQLHQGAVFVIISSVFHWLYFKKLGVNLTQLESQKFTVLFRDIESANWWMVYFFPEYF